MLKNTCSTCGALLANGGVDLHEAWHAGLRLALASLGARDRVYDVNQKGIL